MYIIDNIKYDKAIKINNTPINLFFAYNCIYKL